MLWTTLLNKKGIFKDDKDGIVITHGDTISTLLGALMGKLAGLKVGHVESGLRSFNIFHPFPEELTRVATFGLCDCFFCPGEWAMNNLKKHKGKKINTGVNTLFDSLKWALENSDQIEVEMPQEKYCIISIHRYENMNTRSKFLNMIKIVERIATRIKALFFLHPVTEKKIHQYGFYDRLKGTPQLELRPRYSYFQFIKLLYGSEFMVTDGGSNQEECFYLGKPCLLLRKATERQEGLGKNVCLSQMKDSIIDNFINDYSRFSTPFLQEEITPSSIIVSELKKFQNSNK
jgi:UDP-N-acetylglucosamine 2-epimerase (non-hydrolysing)